MASAIDRLINDNFLIKYINALSTRFAANLAIKPLNSAAIVQEELANARAGLEKVLSYTFITPQDKGLALFYAIKKLAPHTIVAKGWQQLWAQLIETLLEQAQIELMLNGQNPVIHSILYELVASTQDCEATLPLLETYLERLIDKETAILEKITAPGNSRQTDDAIGYCIRTRNISALELLLPCIVTLNNQLACWQRMLACKNEDIINAALASNLLALKYKNAALIEQAAIGNNTIVKLLLTHGATLGQYDPYGTTAFIYAAAHGHHATVQLLLDKGGSSLLAEVNQDGECALLWAAHHGHLTTVQLLLDKGAFIDQIDYNQTTALIVAARRGHFSIVDLLLARGAAINHSNNRESTALIEAVKNGHIGVIELLLARGADIYMRDNQGKSAVDRALPSSLPLLQKHEHSLNSRLKPK